MTGAILLIVGSVLMLLLVVVYSAFILSGRISREEESAGYPEDSY